MRNNLIKLFSGIAFCLCLLFCVGCSGNDTTEKISKMKDTNTKSYYTSNGYVPTKISNYFSISGDVVYFDDGSIFAKRNTNISLSFNSSNYDTSNIPAVNLNDRLVLSAIKINDETFSIFEIDLDKIKVKTDLKVEPIFSNFEIYGVAVLGKSENKINVSDESIFERDDLFYILADSTLENKNLNKNNFESNIKFKFEKSETTSVNFNFAFEMKFDENIDGCYLILKTDTDEFFLFCMDFNEPNEKYEITTNNFGEIFNFTVSFNEDFSTSTI